MRSLACVCVLLAGFGACMPEDADLSYPIVPISGPTVGGGMTGPDAGRVFFDARPINDAGVIDGFIDFADAGDFPQDASPFLDAFAVPLDAFTMPPDAPPFPQGDQIP